MDTEEQPIINPNEADALYAEELTQQPHPEEEVHQERMEQIEKLWEDTSVHTFSLRRHSNYERDPESGRRGSLNQDGIDLAKRAANDWTSKLPSGAEVSIFQSPSYQAAKEIPGEIAGTLREVRPMRATITASLYEKALFGNQEPGRRITESKLGDFFENATSSEGVGAFFKEVGKHYGKLTPQFWKDYAERSLPDSVNEAMLSAGGQDSVGLAGNVAEWLQEKAVMPAEGTSAEQKNVGLAITHGETIYSFLHHASNYLEKSGLADPETVAAFQDLDPDYNQGVDIHVAADKVTVVVANKHAAAFKLDEFKQYLDGVK